MYTPRDIELIDIGKEWNRSSLKTLSSYGERLVSTVSLVQGIFFAVLSAFKVSISESTTFIKIIVFSAPILWFISLVSASLLMIHGIKKYYLDPDTIQKIMDEAITNGTNSLAVSVITLFLGFIMALLAMILLLF